MDTTMHIFEAVGAGAAAGLSPLVAIAALVILAAVHLGINPDSGDIGFVEGVAMLAIAGLVLAQSFLMILTPGGVRVRIAADRPGLLALHTPVAVTIGALAGAAVFNAEGHSALVGALLGAAPAALTALAMSGLLGGVTRRLTAKHAAENAENAGNAGNVAAEGRILAVGVDLATIAAVAAALTAPPLGLLLPIVSVLLLAGARRRREQKHEGLRVLR